MCMVYKLYVCMCIATNLNVGCRSRGCYELELSVGYYILGVEKDLLQMGLLATHPHRTTRKAGMTGAS